MNTKPVEMFQFRFKMEHFEEDQLANNGLHVERKNIEWRFGVKLCEDGYKHLFLKCKDKNQEKAVFKVRLFGYGYENPEHEIPANFYNKTLVTTRNGEFEVVSNQFRLEYYLAPERNTEFFATIYVYSPDHFERLARKERNWRFHFKVGEERHPYSEKKLAAKSAYFRQLMENKVYELQLENEGVDVTAFLSLLEHVKDSNKRSLQFCEDTVFSILALAKKYQFGCVVRNITRYLLKTDDMNLETVLNNIRGFDMPKVERILTKRLIAYQQAQEDAAEEEYDVPVLMEHGDDKKENQETESI